MPRPESMPVQPPVLRQLREAAGLSFLEFAEVTGINRGRLSYIERGIPPTRDEAARILSALREGPDAVVQPTPTP